jgi:hypothetical protein
VIKQNNILVTFSVSLMEPFPLIKTRQPVDASTRFRELPLGPRMRPTKLNYRKFKIEDVRKEMSFIAKG